MNRDHLASVEPIRRRARLRGAVTYLLLVVVPIAVVLLVADPVAPIAAAEGSPGPVYRIVLTIGVIVAVTHLLGAVAARLRQPRVVGYMLAGALLGPAVLGAVAPEVRAWLVPAEILPSLGTLAELGVILFMAVVGMELPLSTLRRAGAVALTVGHAATVIPFAIGMGAAYLLPDGLRPAGIDETLFALFFGLAMSITALPVLAVILAERGLLTRPLGVLGISAAAAGDITAWCALALLLALGSGIGGVLLNVALLGGFAALMVFAVRPLLAALATRVTSVGVVLLVVVLVSAWVSHELGVHAAFGAFLAGVVMPRDAPPVAAFAHRIEGVTHWLLLPMFFAAVGLRLVPGALGSAGAWLLTGAILLLAVVSKLVSAVGAARLMALPWRSSLGLGVMMTCRGLTEIVILDIGLAAGLIGGELFTMMVLMAVATTMLTGPLLSMVDRETPTVSSPDVPAPNRLAA